MKLNRRVTIITRFSGIMFSLLLLGGLAACSDDNNGSDTPEPEPSTYPTTPFSKIELKEVIESDAQPVTATHTYLYNSAGRLTGYTGKQSFTAGDELFEIENTTTVEYKDHQAVITDEAGTVSTYTLNDKGYATHLYQSGYGRKYPYLHLLLPHQHRRQILSGKHHRKAGRRKRILIHYNRLQQLPGIAHTAKG